MRISDWSSDVCSSDLDTIAVRQAEIEHDRVIDRAAQRAVRVRQARGDVAGKAPALEPRDREIRKASIIFDHKDAHLPTYSHPAVILSIGTVIPHNTVPTRESVVLGTRSA